MLLVGQIIFNYLAIDTGGHSINGLPVSAGAYLWILCLHTYATAPLCSNLRLQPSAQQVLYQRLPKGLMVQRQGNGEGSKGSWNGG